MVMKNMIVTMLVLLMGITVSAQDLQKATTKGAVRLFGDKDDLTSVIELIPDNSNVDIIKADSVFTRVRFGEEEGYVRSDKLGPFVPVISPAPIFPPVRADEPQQSSGDVEAYNQPVDWYEVLTTKYGDDIGKRLYQHKVWKGITSDMARDSWGKPTQINRMYVDQSVDEEWIYSKKWLYFRDGILIDWGPVKN
jgi:hypothetical protein